MHHHDPVVESVGVLSDLKILIFNTKKRKETLVCVFVPVFVAAIKNGDRPQWITDAVAGHSHLLLVFSSR